MKNKEVTKNEAKEKVIRSCKTMDKIIGSVIWTIVILYILLFILEMLCINTENLQLLKFQEGVSQVIRNIATINQKAVEFCENNGLISFIKFICIMSIFLAVGQILKHTIKNETPFIQKNIKNIKEIAIYQTILFIVGEAGMLTVFTMWVLYNIFRYGYILQIESDETI